MGPPDVPHRQPTAIRAEVVARIVIELRAEGVTISERTWADTWPTSV